MGSHEQHDDPNWRQSDQYAQGQSGYTAGRNEGDRSLGFQSRNQGYAGNYDDHSRGGDERFSGRGGSAYWQGNQGGYNHEQSYGQQPPYGQPPYAQPPGQFGNYQGQPWQQTPQPDMNAASTKRRHNVGNYGYGSDSYSSQTGSGSMFDQNQGMGMQGRFGGSPGGYGHVGSYGAQGGAQNHGTQGWQGNQSWESNQQQGYGQQSYGQQQTGGHRGKGPKNFQRSDERLHEAVGEALEMHDEIDATHIELLVKNGEVTLSGSVDTRETKRRAEDVVSAVSGVRDVQNQIKVANERATSATGNGSSKDAISTARSEHAMPDTTDSRKARA